MLKRARVCVDGRGGVGTGVQVVGLSPPFPSVNFTKKSALKQCTSDSLSIHGVKTWMYKMDKL